MISPKPCLSSVMRRKDCPKFTEVYRLLFPCILHVLVIVTRLFKQPFIASGRSCKLCFSSQEPIRCSSPHFSTPECTWKDTKLRQVMEVISTAKDYVWTSRVPSGGLPETLKWLFPRTFYLSGLANLPEIDVVTKRFRDLLKNIRQAVSRASSQELASYGTSVASVVDLTAVAWPTSAHLLPKLNAFYRGIFSILHLTARCQTLTIEQWSIEFWPIGLGR